MPHVFAVEFHTWIVDPDDVVEKLLAIWTPFWMRDSAEDQCSVDNWKDASTLFEAHLPNLPEMPLTHFTFTRGKKPSSGRRPRQPKVLAGLVGMSCCRFLIKPTLILEIVQAIQDGAPWPVVITTARTVFLRKSDDNFEPGYKTHNHFQSVYRVWSKAWVRHALLHLAHLPCTLAGGVPKTSTRDIWYLLQHQLGRIFQVTGRVLA